MVAIAPSATARATELLRRPRYEVIPLDGTLEQVLAHVPREVTVTVTVSPTKGLEPTLELAGVLARHDGNVTHAAHVLGLSRAMLQRKMKDLGLR